MMHRNRSVDVHQFAMVPRADIPRAAFKMQKAYKTTFDTGYLYPIFVEEILPGDTFRVKLTAFARLATPIFPMMDNMYLDTFFFFVPNRLVWSNWKKFMGEQRNINDSISYVIPKINSDVGGFPVGSMADYFGVPCAGQTAPDKIISINALPARGYNLIYNEWFRDQNLIDSAVNNMGDGPDNRLDYPLRRRAKRHDYFTSALPWPQKGGVSVKIPIGTSAPVVPDGTSPTWQRIGMPMAPFASQTRIAAPGTQPSAIVIGPVTGGSSIDDGSNPIGFRTSGLIADLSAATSATINQLRQSFQIQKLLERDARGGTRYTEIVRAHFGVMSPDARLQRPEYLGGGSAPMVLSPIAQTSGTGLTGQTTPLGNLAAVGTLLANGHGFSQSFTEHGYVIGLVMVRADVTYQQGMRRHWSRNTRYDYYFPAFAMLGEQAILNKEIYTTGNSSDLDVFGYQERWAEYRYSPSEVTGLFRSTSPGTLDAWHLAQRFTSLPLLNQTFIEENPPMARVLAVGAAAGGAQIIFDGFFDMHVVRPMPLYSVPGLIDHF